MMKRILLFLLVAAAAGCGRSETLSMLVGTYTDGGSEGIYAYGFDTENGRIVGKNAGFPEAPGAFARAVMSNPSYLAVFGPDKVYAVSEMSDNSSGIGRLVFDRASGSLELKETARTFGEAPCHVSTNGKMAITSNYTGGSLSVFRLDADGDAEFKSEPAIFPGEAGGPDTVRQMTPHVHCSVFSPDGKYLFASDFSADRIMIKEVCEDGYCLKDSGFAAMEADSGPRHLVFDASGQNLYVIGELSGNVSVFGCKGGALTLKQTIKADPADGRASADIRISPDGRFLYASCRNADDGIAIFSIRKDGTLQAEGYRRTGKHPRNFVITPDGRFLLAACRDSDKIQIFKRDAGSGMLEDTGNEIRLSHPVCIAFVPEEGKSLPRRKWNRYAHTELQRLIRTEGLGSSDYNPACRPYAVFDFDNTSIIGDIELSTMAFQIENLRFRISPEAMFETLTECVPDLDKVLRIKGTAGITARMLAEDLTEDYKVLHANYISSFENPHSEEAVKALEKISETEEYLDFRAKVWALSAGIDGTFDYGVSCLWILKLLEGMTDAELSSLVDEAVDHAMGMERIEKRVWTSPDMGLCGKISVTLTRGLGIAPEMKDLYKTLQSNGFGVYVCSASMESIVEQLACDPVRGFGLPASNVFGVRLADDGSGVINAEYEEDYPQTYMEGKALAIRKFIAPLHGGKEPSLVAGDSNGDFAMLTGFPGLKTGLIINCLNGGKIGELTERGLRKEREEGKTVYIVQGRNEGRKKFRR